MRILVCNDDGIDAAGLALLADAARAVSADVWIVAPERKWTAASHQITFDATLALTRRAERVYACSGAPADCVIAAMTLLCNDAPRFGLVLCGVNDKRNVGEDLAYSGTTAIAREATFFGVPAIAFARDAPAARGDRDHLADILRVLWNARTTWSQAGQWLGVNLPASLPAVIVEARVGRDKIGASCEVLDATPSRIAYRLRRGRPGTAEPGDENARLQAGEIAVSCFRWDAQVALPGPVVAAWNADGRMRD